jgi:hypothetical protein
MSQYELELDCEGNMSLEDTSGSLLFALRLYGYTSRVECDLANTASSLSPVISTTKLINRTIAGITIK